MPLEKSQPKKKVLFIANHRLNRSPGQRFRFEQYIPFLIENGYDCTLSFLINEKDDKILYAKGFYFQKTVLFFKTYFIRLKNLFRIKDYDVVFVFREALLTGSTFFERQVKKRGVKKIDIINGKNNFLFKFNNFISNIFFNFLLWSWKIKFTK